MKERDRETERKRQRDRDRAVCLKRSLIFQILIRMLCVDFSDGLTMQHCSNVPSSSVLRAVPLDNGRRSRHWPLTIDNMHWRLTMDNGSFEDSNVYANCPAPDVVIRQPITSQPSNKHAVEEPTATKPGNDVKTENKKMAGPRKKLETSDKIYSLDSEQTRRDWTSDLFFSLTGNPHSRTFKDNARQGKLKFH